MDIAELKLALDNSCLEIDKFSGNCQIKLPMGELLGQINGVPLKLELKGQLHDSSKLPTLNFYDVGTWRMSGGSSYDKYEIHVSDVPLVNGSSMSANTDDKGSHSAVGPGYVFDATRILTMRKNAFKDTIYEFQQKPLKDQTFTVMHTTGIAEIFDCVGERTKGASEPPLVLTREILESNGKGLKFTWHTENGDARITEIQDSIGTVLTARWDWSDKQAPKLSQLVLYPNSHEAVQYDCRYEDDALEVSLTKQHPFLDKTVYRLETGADHIKMRTTTHFKKKNSDIQTSKIEFNRHIDETLTWKGDKTKTHTIELPDSTARLTRTWNWQKNVTHITLASEQKPSTQTSEAKTTSQSEENVETLEDVTYKHSDGIIKSLESKSRNSTSLPTWEVTSDPKARTSTSCMTHTVDGVEISKTESTFNAQGNLIEIKRGDEKIQWTHFNNYTHYSTESEITDDAGPLIEALGWIIKGGHPSLHLLNFASNTVRKFTTFRSSAPNNYAKDSFNLPLDINYPGDELGFSNHIESERVTQVNAEGETTTRITYFGYDKVPTIPNDLIDRNHVVVLARKLTVLMPKVSTVSVTEAQRAIADKAIEQMVTALKVCINSVKDDDYLREGYEASMASIKNAAKAQSEMNDKGFKLDTWQNVPMTVEEFTYDTAPTSAHFCTLKSSTVYSLDEAGSKIESSEVNTILTYETNSKAPRRITTNTLSTSSKEVLKTSYVQEGFARTPVERTDAAGIKTQYGFVNGALSTTKITQGTSTLSSARIGYSIDAEKRTIQMQINDEKGLNRRITYDERGRIRAEWTNMIGSEDAWRQSSEATYNESGGTITKYIYDTQGKQHELSVEHFDTHGNSTQLFEYDYDALGNIFDIRTTEWTSTPTEITKKIVMKDRDGTVLDTRTQTEQRKGSEIVIKRGAFTETYKWDASQRKAHYSNGNKGAAETLQLTIDHDSYGQPIRTQYSKKMGEKIIDISLHTTEYNVHGLPRKITADSAPPLTFEYDATGRLTKKEKDGAVLSYEYEKDSASPTPISMSMLEATKADESRNEAAPTLLGKQTLDAWGRMATQTVNGVTRSYTYAGASSIASPNPQSIDNLFKGYTQKWNSRDRTYTETCSYSAEASDDRSQTLSTQSELSLRGRLIKMTDIAGQQTSYTYDTFNRVIKQVNPACITTAVFTDDGRLQSEAVQDVTSKRVMSISYSYDVLGRETERRFTSDGMDTIVLQRELSPAGRLVKHSLNVSDKPKYIHEYEYNDRGQLVDWNGNGASYSLQTRDYYREAYGYDAIGNMTTYGFNDTNDAKKPGMHPRKFSTDIPGLLLEFRGSKLQNKNGRISENISYSDDGRVSHIIWPVSYGPKHPELHFTYDSTGRVRALFTSGGNDAPRGFQLHYRGDRVYARSQKTTNGRFWNGTLAKTDIIINESVGCSLRQTISFDKDDKKSALVSFELRDASGTIFATVKTDGKLGAWHNYSPYGHRNVDLEWTDWLGFKGEVIYPRAFYYLGSYRAYDPSLMTFCSPDDASPFGFGGPATYAFCAGDPINYHDPSGHMRVSHLSAVVAPPIMTTKEFRIFVAVGSIITAPIGGGALAAMLGVVAGGLELASVLVEDSDPELASALNVLSFGTGMGSLAAGLSGVTRLTGAASKGMIRTRIVLNKTMAGVGGYRYIDDSLRLWEDTHKGVKRLVIQVHGVADEAGRALGQVATSEGNLSAGEFLEYLAKKGVNIDDYGKIKMHSCHSASHHNSFGDSFAKDLARLTKKEVKGYQGKMHLSLALGEILTNPAQYFDDPSIYQLLGNETGKAELLQAWRPRKIEWARDINGLPMFDSNGIAIPRSFNRFKPVTFKPRPGSWQIDELLGDHSYEKVIKRFNKNPGAYSDPYEELNNFQRKQEGTLLRYLLDGDSLC
ncbi:RHS repeat-associated core domain-containing protein [Pseudomonas monteilii]|uniref:RHS repeat-associated core domain-containing protein n=2 Tax=Pseudomonas TaxID=286 RepID=UPI001FCFEB09|nr:RHS repeat-associated core domain-containing protein [Pseudomonas monteilii]MCJ7851015.1 hypothetical protein [Pseudomonas monteilii]